MNINDEKMTNLANSQNQIIGDIINAKFPYN
ncbi:hypothetical protein T03_9626 [Trichinella britovi]|uniref:Uncharacterized protein n=4 Tax=Trichinella TaxID=6333 RepID=A0A0V1AIQ3_TRIBR|nr:hypothetical protein T05_3334 [Trichinella murrelli]KRY02339.1 hypothetical protein T12_9563 [Trichinella patagoniensis]KRY24156.1 hypothetical protein T01_3331 [Trichinella spiralis]KRY24683.1 hypothetical protein T03_5027 [Trichinella britovi]KRX33360.1 hypothetical protein T05_16170 [Trichinella murrelli]